MKGVSTRNYKANHKGEMKFGKCLSCGKFHYRNSCVFRNAKCFKCGKVEHIQSVCKANVHFASSCTKSWKLNFNNSDVSKEHFSLSTISKAIFQKVINKVVSDLEGVEVYQDDLIIHGSDKVVHDQRLIALLRRLTDKNITVNPDKCSFCLSSFECLRYLVDNNGFRPDMKRLAPLTSAPSLKNLTELRSLVGALEYYSRFIPNFSCRANCLFNILTSNSFKWSEEQESCLHFVFIIGVGIYVTHKRAPLSSSDHCIIRVLTKVYGKHENSTLLHQTKNSNIGITQKKISEI
ncbi:unnamed protein product [Schistosoma margrebowiei]|uniref:Reverse transcriptase domain-containing protein n=1 Tax=Schistosoma margrebowiei TaxID=48269 RepID=A0A183LN08_9TREM|nr:unnamed protein product [Schistosoma margrebowiei]